MKTESSYDLLIIGGGISACVFASKYLQNNITKKIALIEVGRRLGGRSSTRISKRFEGWKLNHGSPNFNISNSRNNLLLKTYIDELLENKFIKIDDSELIYLDENSNFEELNNSEFSCGVNYRSLFSMGQLSQNIMQFNNLMDKVDFYFETFIVDLKFINNEWILTSSTGDKFKSKYLICSSNLLMHKRVLKILNINQIPLRKAIPKNENTYIFLDNNLYNNNFHLYKLKKLI